MKQGQSSDPLLGVKRGLSYLQIYGSIRQTHYLALKMLASIKIAKESDPSDIGQKESVREVLAILFSLFFSSKLNLVY